MERVAFVAAARTPTGGYLGRLREVPVYRLASLVLNTAVERAGIEPAQVDDVIMGSAYQGGECANGARFAVLDAGWPDTVPGVTIDRRCCSGLHSVFWGVTKIQTGNADIVLAGGMDSMSQAELYLPGDIKWGLGGRQHEKYGFMPRGHGALAMWGLPLYDRVQRARVMSQPVERYGELSSMMSWAEAAATNEGVSREECDAWALRSHQKAIAAQDAGRFRDEIVPVRVPAETGEILVGEDEGPRRDTSLEKLARLKSIYPDGVCTAGNSSSEGDGAAVVVLASERVVQNLGLHPLGYYRACAVAATDPTLTYPAAPEAVSRALAKAGLALADMEILEIQEAFAAQTLADARMCGLSLDDMDEKVNVNGSGISLGHPIAATGAMRLTTLLYQLRRQDGRLGLETICGGGGQGICLTVERAG